MKSVPNQNDQIDQVAQLQSNPELNAMLIAQQLAAAAPQSNLETLTELVTQTAVIFYLVESPENPAVQTYWDALHYISTSLSVGYANIFPVTPTGKAIGAAIMMIGPALSSRALEAPPREPEPNLLLGRLEEILAELRLQNGARAASVVET